MAKKMNPDDLIGALEKVLTRFKVTMEVKRFTGDVVLYDVDGMEVCNFRKLDGHDGPSALEIGREYEDSYSIS